MTIIAATTNGTEAWIGCDTQVGHDEFKTETLEPNGKLIDLGPVVLGIAGNIAAYNHVAYDMASALREMAMESDLDMRRLIKAIDDEIAGELNDQYDNLEYDIAYACNKWVAESSQARDLLFARTTAIGTGYQYALGAMSVINTPGNLQIRAGIEAANKYNPHCNNKAIIIKVQ